MLLLLQFWFLSTKLFLCVLNDSPDISYFTEILKFQILFFLKKIEFNIFSGQLEKKKIANILAMAHHTVKRSNILGLEAASRPYVVYLWPCSVLGHFGVIRWTCDFSRKTNSKLYSYNFDFSFFNQAFSTYSLWSSSQMLHIEILKFQI